MDTAAKVYELWPRSILSRDQLRTQKCIRLMPKAEATKLGPVHFHRRLRGGYDRNAANEVAES